MSGSSKQGFTIVEILVVIALLAAMAALVLPNLRPAIPSQERKQFVTKFNALMRFSWQQALLTGQVQRVVFDIDRRQIHLQGATGVDNKGESTFADLETDYVRTDLVWPEQLEIRNLYIEGYDEMTRNKKTEKVWFYLVPDGLTQRVTINMIDNEDIQDGKVVRMSLVLNPYTAQFNVYDEFKN